MKPFNCTQKNYLQCLEIIYWVIERIWHYKTYNGWYAFKTNQNQYIILLISISFGSYRSINLWVCLYLYIYIYIYIYYIYIYIYNIILYISDSINIYLIRFGSSLSLSYIYIYIYIYVCIGLRFIKCIWYSSCFIPLFNALYISFFSQNK